MTSAILIGFQYNSNILPGAIIDLYHAYRWCNTFCKEIYIFTDVISVYDHKVIDHAIELKIVDEQILHFIDDVPKINVQNRLDLLNGIASVLMTSFEKLVIYYSGHGVSNAFVMPNNEILPSLEFRDSILNSLQPTCEIFWILDCCCPNGLNLPFTLRDKIFRMTKEFSCVIQPIILITSSITSEKSFATRLDSLFTRYLFKILIDMNNLNKIKVNSSDIYIPLYNNRNLSRLIRTIMNRINQQHSDTKQQVSIYSSYQIDPVLWLWIGSNRPYDISMNLSLSTFVIR